MSQIAPRMSRTWWPVWCRRAWWGGMEPGRNFGRGGGRRGGLGLGRRCMDDVDATVGWGRGWGQGGGRGLGPGAGRGMGQGGGRGLGQGAGLGMGQGVCRRNVMLDSCRRGLGPDTCGRGVMRGPGRRWLDDMDSPLEFGAGQRWLAPFGGGMGRGQWCRQWWRNDSEAVGDRAVEVKCDADVYEVRLKVNDFAPDELAVRVKGGELMVEGEQSELPAQHGSSSRQFTRRFLLPPGVEGDTLESEFTEDGFLVISGKMKSASADRTINVSAKEP